jgi:hypothetical protein
MILFTIKHFFDSHNYDIDKLELMNKIQEIKNKLSLIKQKVDQKNTKKAVMYRTTENPKGFTPKFSIQFSLWKNQGIKKILQFFLNIGLSLKEMIKPWFFLHIDKRKYLKKKIIKESCRFGIQIVKYNLFIKNYCNFINKKKYIKEILSAIDFIHAVSALLDYEFFKNKKKKSQNFPKVFNSFSDYKKLKIGLEISQKIQKFVSTSKIQY